MNIQNVSKRPGIREAFIPRKGWLFAQADYPQLELYTLAQCCMSWLGESRLVTMLLSGLDPHLAFAGDMRRTTYAAAEAALNDSKHPEHKDVRRARQLAKCANFGFPGGMIPETLVAYAKGSMPRAKFLELQLDEQRAHELSDQWHASFPEMRAYFARARALYQRRAPIESLFTGRFRGGASYCAICNNPFQGLGADCAKNSAWKISRAQYVDIESPLFNTRTVAMVHDEFILEVPDDDRASPAAFALGDTMRVAANELLPDVPIAASKMKPLLMRRWSKDAEQVLNSEGQIIPWEKAKQAS